LELQAKNKERKEEKKVAMLLMPNAQRAIDHKSHSGETFLIARTMR